MALTKLKKYSSRFVYASWVVVALASSLRELVLDDVAEFVAVVLFVAVLAEPQSELVTL